MLKHVLFISALVIFTMKALCQSKEIDMDPVTVTSSVNSLPASKTGRNIISIPGDRFAQLPIHSIDDLLRYVPGIEIQMRGPAGSQSDITVRGATFEQVLVILDGIKVNDPNSGHFASYIPIAPSEIDHIEILKGASSAIYGSEAVGGVICIITKSFAARKGQSLKGLQATLTGGEYNLLNGNVGGEYSNGKTVVEGGVLSNNSNGQVQRGTRGFFHNNTASLSFKEFLKNNWDFAARSSYDDRDFGAQNFYTTFASDTASEKVSSFWNQVRAAHAGEKHLITLDAGYKAVKDHYAYNPSSIANENHSNLFQSEITDNFSLNSFAHLVTGVQYQRKWIHSNDRGSHLTNQLAGFAVWNQIFHDFTLSPSLRLDGSSDRGTELVPQLNISYHHALWQLRASAGKTIRDADFTERYNNYNKAFVSGGSIGNPYLAPERSFSYEAGADYFAAKGIKVSATIFRRDQTNVIDWAPTPYSNMPRQINLSPTGSYALASNIANVTTTGLETDVQFQKALTNHQQIFATLGLVWLDDETNEAVPSFYISSHAKFLTNLMIQYNNRYFSIVAAGIYKHRLPQSASAINAQISSNSFSMNMQADIVLVQKKVNLFVEVDNITNDISSDLLGSVLPGRWLMGGVKLNLDGKK